jgi:hypothetical protein
VRTLPYQRQAARHRLAAAPRPLCVCAKLGSLILLLLSPVAWGDRPLIAVVPFMGPQAKQAEATVVRTLRHKASLVPPTTWEKSAQKLFAKTHNPDDIASVAEDVGAVVVITGVVKRDGRTWQLAVSVRDGKTGRSHDKLKYPLKGPRVTESTLRLLAEEVEIAFEHTLAAAGHPPAPTATAPPEEEPKARPQAKVEAKVEAKTETKVEAKLEPKTRTETREPEPETRVAEEEPPPHRDLGTVEKPLPTTRPRWAPWLDADVGAIISGRSFDFDPSSQPRFKSGVTGGIRIDATVYPLAFTWRKAAGVFATLGLGVTFQKPFWIDSTSKSDPTQTFPTTETQVEGGLRWRFVLYKKVPRPELTLLVGGGLHSFGIQKDVNGMDVGPPDVSYQYLAVGGGFKIHFLEWAALFAQFTYHAVFNAGSVQDNLEFGSGPVYGLRAGGGLDFLVWHGLKVGALGYYERYVIAFTGAGSPQKVASSAVDQYFGGVLVIGYVF